MSRFHLWLQRNFAFGLAVVTLVIALSLSFSIYREYKARVHEVQFYDETELIASLERLRPRSVNLVVCIAAPVVLFGFPFWVFATFRKKTNPYRKLIGALMVLFASILLCGSSAVMCWLSLDGGMSEFAITEDIAFQNRYYHLTERYPLLGIGGAGTANFVLYECEHWRERCKELHRVRITTLTDENSRTVVDTALQIDTDSNTISMLMNEKNVFTHHPN